MKKLALLLLLLLLSGCSRNGAGKVDKPLDSSKAVMLSAGDCYRMMSGDAMWINRTCRVMYVGKYSVKHNNIADKSDPWEVVESGYMYNPERDPRQGFENIKKVSCPKELLP